MKRKLLSVVLVMAMTFSNVIMLSGVATAESNHILDNPTADASGTLCEGVNYNYVHATKTLTISKASEASEGIIPGYNWDTVPFVDIELSSLVFEEGITSVGKFLIDESTIKGVSLPATLTCFGGIYTGYAVLDDCVVGSDGFTVAAGNTNFCAIDGSLYSYDQTTLYKFGGSSKSYTTPSTVEHVAFEAFNELSLDTLTFGGNNSYWNDYAVRDCHIKHIVLAEGVKDLGDYSGVYPETLEDTEIILPASLTNYGGSQGLLNNKKIQSFNVAEGSTTYKSIDGVLYSKDGTTLVYYPVGKTGKSYVTPDSVTTIGNGAFAINEYNKNLKNITLGKNVTEIEAYGLYLALDSLTFLNDSTAINDGAFSTSRYPAKIYGKAGSTAESFASSKSIPFVELTEKDINNIRLFYGKSQLRIAGDNRYLTGIQTANKLKEALGIDEFNSVIITRGDNYPDALAGGYLSAVNDTAPILLTNTDYNSKIIEYVKDNVKSNSKVYILGNENSVARTMDTQLSAAGYNVERLEGESRIETNIEILEEAGIPDDSELIVCNAWNYADSLAASSLGKPILIVQGTDLTNAQKTFMIGKKFSKIYVLGGDNAVSSELESNLVEYTKSNKAEDVERIAGSSRVETSTLVAEKFYKNSPKSVVLAYAWNYPDGLSGGPLAQAIGAPIVLTSSSSAEVETARNYVSSVETMTNGAVLGGDQADRINAIAFNRIMTK